MSGEKMNESNQVGVGYETDAMVRDMCAGWMLYGFM